MAARAGHLVATDQAGTVATRFGQLATLTGWPQSVATLRPAASPDDARTRLTDLVTASTVRYLTRGHASPVLLVHTATAPNAVLHTMPALPRELWAPSLSAVWAATAAIFSAYAPGEGAPRWQLHSAPTGPDAVAEALDRAVTHADEHVIKFTDTATEVYTRTGNPEALGAATYLVPPVAIVLAWALLGETPWALALVGGAVCLAGMYIVRRAPAPS